MRWVYWGMILDYILNLKECFNKERQRFINLCRDIWRHASPQLLVEDLGKFCVLTIKDNIRQDCAQNHLFHCIAMKWRTVVELPHQGSLIRCKFHMCTTRDGYLLNTQVVSTEICVYSEKGWGKISYGINFVL